MIKTNNMENINEYQKIVNNYAIHPKKYNVIYPVLGMCGEAGEAAEKIKKIIRDKNEIFDDEAKKEIAKELGDVICYIAFIAEDLNLQLSDILQLNIDKIQSRFNRNVMHGEGDNR